MSEIERREIHTLRTKLDEAIQERDEAVERRLETVCWVAELTRERDKALEAARWLAKLQPNAISHEDAEQWPWIEQEEEWLCCTCRRPLSSETAIPDEGDLWFCFDCVAAWEKDNKAHWEDGTPIKENDNGSADRDVTNGRFQENVESEQSR